MKKTIALLLAMILLLTGCSGTVSCGEDLMKGVKPSDEQGKELVTIDDGTRGQFSGPSWDNALVADFGVRLLQASMEEDKNTLISPLSVLCALAMTANGADGNTLAQMEAVLGQSVEALNNWYKYGADKDGEFLHLANGIWFKDDPYFTVEESFLQTNADYYGAGIYKAAFDEATLKDINSFVEEKTDGMVKDILDEIPEDAVMYLVNALAFDAQWQEVYKENQVHEDVFTTEGGAEQDVELMYSEEYAYLEDEKATGFLKYYEGRRYAFAALLPNEGVSVEEYVQGLTGEQLYQLLAEPQDAMVNAAIPKFETEYDTQMSEVLAEMGMPDAFDWTVADFSKLGSYEGLNICIDRVLHKTFISVAEQGTKAGAATVVEMVAEGAMEVTHSVILNRPFVYMIMDMESNTPIFMGTLMYTGEEAPEICIDHSHEPAQEPALCAYPTTGYCGNIQTTVYLDGEEYTFMYDDSVALTDMLINLDYDPNMVCRCITEVTVDTELGGPYDINLGQYFVRCDSGQAALTEEQAQTIRDIIDRL